MATGPLPGESPAYWKEQDRIERRYQQAIEDGEITLRWWHGAAEFAIAVVVLIIAGAALAIHAVYTAVTRPFRRQSAKGNNL